MANIETDAVNEPDLTTILSQVLGISSTGVEICVHMTGAEERATAEIATALGVNRSTVNRQLSQLRELGLIESRERSLKEGGQVYLHSPVPPEEMRRRHREALLSWITDAIELIDDMWGQSTTSVSETAIGVECPGGTAGDE
jgi:predicted transcriptional regulator